MNRQSVLRIAAHGVLLLLLGMLVGVPFVGAITSGAGPDAERAWRVAHTSLVSVGTLYVAIAAIAPLLSLSERAGAFVTWSFLLSAYAFAFAFVVGPMVGARGLEPTGPAVNVLVFVVVVASLLAFFLAVVVVLWGLLVAMRAGAR